MVDHKGIQKSEVSLKYMAWNIKQIAENVKAIAKAIETLIAIKSEDLAKMSQIENKAPSVPKD